MRYTPTGGAAFQPDPDRYRPAAVRPVAADRLSADARRCAAVVEQLEQAQREVRAGDALVPGARTAVPHHRGSHRRRRLHVPRHHGAQARRRCLRESEQQFRAMVSQASAGVAHMDLAGRITLTNRRFGEFTGFSDDELHSAPSAGPDASGGPARARASCSTGSSASAPHSRWKSRLLRKDGGEVWVKASVTALARRSGQGELGGRVHARCQRRGRRTRSARAERGPPADDHRERARIRDRLDGPAATRHELELGRGTAAGLPRRRDPQSAGRPDLHAGGPCRRGRRSRKRRRR